MKLSSTISRLSQLIMLLFIGREAAGWLSTHMTGGDLLRLSGPIGLATSLLVLALTRWERRPHLNFLVSMTDRCKVADDSLPQEKTIEIAITNLGITPIQLDVHTLEVERKNERFKPCFDAGGRSKVDQPTLALGGQYLVELSYYSFLELLKLDPPEHHNEKTFGKDAAICISIRGPNGKRYSSSRNHYSEETGTFFYV